jgi:transcriptional regulator with XRE-family HTH domain
VIWAPRIIQAYRRNQGWSQMELARQLGYGRSTVAHWEQGLRYPTRRSMQRLDAVFGFIPAWEAKYPPICPLCQIARTDWTKRDCGSCRGKRYRARKRSKHGISG